MNTHVKRITHVAALLFFSMLGACGSNQEKGSGTANNEAAAHIKKGEQLLYKHQAGTKDDPDYIRSVQEFRTALRLDPNSATASYRLADALIRTEKYEEGLQALRDLKASQAKP